MPMPDLPTVPNTVEATNNNTAVAVNGTPDIPVDPILSEVPRSSLVPAKDVLSSGGHISARGNKIPVDEECLAAYSSMNSFCHNIQSWHAHDPKKPLHYLITRFKGFVTDIATNNATPFLHQNLYGDDTPPCIVTCFTTAVLYANRTKRNRAMVMQALHNRSLDFISNEADFIALTPVQKLARTQTLFIYQIIRLLDSDIIMRSRSEKFNDLLANWLDDLCEIRDNLEDITNQNDFSQMPAPDWHIMNDMSAADLPGAWAYTHRWTLSRHLWEATSSSHFQRMWKEKPQFVISNYSFARFLEKGKGDDVDSFAEIPLNLYLGVDQTADFIASRSGG
ncbi:putative C6 zinc finger domain-containing protein [Fusarium austroafricanum]|uniref:Putative C6 zinc finger domain-containing protein n=1 Tax=Fusarium austroafricanum TaxID=2364996 RepID=A0A8H4JZ13_9HYPO|nr:putative C6 zinc finger domain-containing protein [Fusarium austroafricanum]